MSLELGMTGLVRPNVLVEASCDLNTGVFISTDDKCTGSATVLGNNTVKLSAR